MTDANHLGNLSTFRLRRRTPGSFLLVPCPKQGRSIRCQGQLEAATAVILIACPQVVHVQEQPLTIWYAWRGTEGSVEIQLLDGPPTAPCKREKGAGISYIVPDFLVEMADGQKHLVEVKASSRIARPLVQRKLAVGRLFAAQEGWTFHVVTEKELLPGPLLNNVRLLNRYQWRVLKRAIRERFDGPEHLQNLSAGRNAIREVVEEAVRKPSRSRRVRAARYLQPPPSTMNSLVEPTDLASAVSPPAAAAPSCEEPATGADQVDDRQSENPLPTVDPAEIDVSDWEVASPDRGSA